MFMTTAPVSEPSAKRKLGIACDACRFRKVKCDRHARLGKGHASCSNCVDNTIECILTVHKPKKRLGKRLKVLQEQQEAASVPAGLSSEGSSTQESPEDPLQAALTPGLSSLLEAVAQDTNHASSSSASASETPVPIIQNSMFASFVAGEPHIFDSTEMRSAQTHLRPSPSTQTSSSPPSFPRSSNMQSPDPLAVLSSAAFFTNQNTADALEGGVAQKRTPLDRVPATSSHQVGFVGGLLGIASLDKAMLDVCTQAYFNSVGSCIGFIRQEWWWPRYHAYFARYAGMSHYESETSDEPLSELLVIAVACRGCGTTNFANRFELQNDLLTHYRRLIKDTSRLIRDGWDAIESVILMVEHLADGKPRTPPDAMSVHEVYDIDVLSHEGLVRLMKKFELNRAKPFDKTLEGKDEIRHRILFWVIFIYDAIRSEAGRTLPLIQDEEITVTYDIPFLLRTDVRILFRDHFVRMARICRKVTYKVLAQVAATNGVRPKDVSEILDELQVWYSELHSSLQWDFGDMLHISGPQEEEPRIRRTFLIYLYLGQWLLLYYAVKDYGWSSGGNEDECLAVKTRLDAELDTAFERQVLVCDHGTLFGVIRLHPGMMQSWTVTWCWWILERMINISQAEVQGRLASAKASDTFARYQSAAITFINAVATCDSNPDTPQIVQSLLDCLRSLTGQRTNARSAFGFI